MSRIELRYQERTPRSAELARVAERLMPGGDTRAAAYFPPYPVTMVRGAGPFLWDADGNRYIDLIGNYTSLVHGNAYPPIVDAMQAWAARGTAWAARCEPALDLAAQLTERVASAEQIRFTNSGTEAAMLAIQIAKVVTGRDKILMATHGYHGSHEDTEVGFFGSEGPRTYLAAYGDAAAFARVLDQHRAELACVLLEPVMGSGGIVAAPPGFLAEVAEATRRAGALFILDEVICLRLAAGGAQSLHGVSPDLTLFGKLIGGGLPVGAVGGRAGLLAVTDPRQLRMFVSGTFNGNPITMAAGTVAVRELTAERISVMHRLAERLRTGLARGAAAHGLPFSVNHAGSLMNVFFTPTAPAARLVRTDAPTMYRFHLAALNHGLFIAPRGMIALSTVMADALIEEIVERATAAFADVAADAD
jgi:glutamate-1-semialdehyde 2,1-aminomutase